MQHGNTSIGLRSRWYDELTSMHWRVLRASFLGWIMRVSSSVSHCSAGGSAA